MIRSIIGLLAATIAALVSAASGALERGFIGKFCVAPPHDTLCPVLPYDQAALRPGGLRLALRLHGDRERRAGPLRRLRLAGLCRPQLARRRAGRGLPPRIGEAPSAPRVWQAFTRRDALVGPDPAKEACGGERVAGALLIGDLVQPDGSVLIDQRGNFVVYESRANAVAAGYIRANQLDRIAGQTAFLRDQSIDFPVGRLPDAMAIFYGAIEELSGGCS